MMEKLAGGACIAILLFGGLVVWILERNIKSAKATIATLETQNRELTAINNELLALVKTQAAALEQIKAQAAEQSERLAKAQAQAAINRAASEVRVREILTVAAPDDPHELVAWAVLEAQKLDIGGMK